MSKIRIYELAKELGVENKAVIARAVELGFSGKGSHSSSLEGHEADQIRRSIIRDTIGKNTEDSQSERFTTRVNKVTGETQAIVESRKGNVIRRRKQSPAEEAAEREAELAAASAAEAEAKAQAGPLSAADELFNTPQSQENPVEESSQEDTQGIAAESDTEEHPAAAALSTREAGTVTESGAAMQEAAPSPVSSPLAENVPHETSVSSNGSSAHAVIEEPAPVRAPQVAPKSAEDETKRIGPKVLGKISLPQPKKPAAPPAGRPFSNQSEAPAPTGEEEEDEEGKKKTSSKKKGRKREFNRVDLVDYEGRDVRRGGPKSGKQRGRDETKEAERLSPEAKSPKASKRVVKINEAITVGELSRQMSMKAGEVIAKLIQLGVLATINQSIDLDTATVIAEEFGFQVESTGFDESDVLVEVTPEDPEHLVPRAPVVTVMGHVDHGKTSLLDTIRESSVAEREHGGITQHIGAYSVKIPGVEKHGGRVAFIDTPGHAAFTSMRARGAKVTDIVVLVVAADDGVMPQTIEAINHAKAAEVPIVVAINKIDKPDANQERIKQQLVERGLQPEDWGGDTMFFPVSALKKQGIQQLMEGILLIAEMKELKANPTRRAKGTIIEAKQDKGRGTVATVLVQNGTLRVGDVFVSGAEYGRVRSMRSDSEVRLDEAGPSTPVEITGITGVPMAGDDFTVVESEAKAKEVAESRSQKKALTEFRSGGGPISLEEFSRRAGTQSVQELKVILKTDVHGSLEAVRDSIEKLSNPKVKVAVLHGAVGAITESDVQLAVASQAIVVGFGVRADTRASIVAENVGVELRFYRIIYELLEDVKKAMAGLLAPIRQEVRTGRVEVRETFNLPKAGTVAGCYVVDGVVKRGSFIRLLRDSKVVHEGKMSSLKRFKDDVREVQSGYECGVMIDGYNDVKPGDVLEVFEIKEVAATLD